MSEADDLGSGTWTARRDGGETMLVRKWRLEVVAGPDAGSSQSFASPVLVIGRSGGDLILTDRRVSALHARDPARRLLFMTTGRLAEPGSQPWCGRGPRRDG